MTDEIRLPGECLKEERERQHLSLRDAAEKLHMSVSYVKALEADDYERLPEATFVKGYIRNYANLLKLPADGLLKTYSAMTQPPKVELAVESLPREPSSAWRLVWLGILLIVLLLVLLGGWYGWQHWKGDSEAAAPITPSQVEAPVDDGLDSNGDINTQRSDAAAVTQTDADDNSASHVDNTAMPKEEVGTTALAEQVPASSAADGDAVASVEAPSTFTDTDSKTDEITTADTGTISADTAAEEDTAAADADVVATEDDQAIADEVARLQVAFKGDCWVGVTDASGKVLYKGAKHADSLLDVSGETPLSVVFGNAGAVASITLNDNAVDVSGMRPGAVKRMQLP